MEQSEHESNRQPGNTSEKDGGLEPAKVVCSVKHIESETSDWSLVLRKPWDERPQKEEEDVVERRPQKEEFMMVEYMLRDMLSKYSELDLFSKRYMKEVNAMLSILESMDGEPQCDEILRQLEIVSRLADSQRQLRNYEKENGNSWRSICYPLAPYSICEMPHLERQLEIVRKEVGPLLVRGTLQSTTRASNGMGNLDVASNGMGLDVVSLLSPTLVAQTGEHIEVESVFRSRSKYVLVFCVHAPILFGSQDFQSLLNLCRELCSERHDVVIVMVATMNILADTKQDFDHVFSGFPESCLAVPYEDWERRERIWKLLDGHFKHFRCVVYDPSGLFLTSFLDGFPCGAEAFPFDELTVQNVLEKREQLRRDRLENLLRPYESSQPDGVVVYELNGTQEKRISEVIKNKHVGLYLCCPGYELLPFLQKLYEEKKEEFEIVVLYLPHRSCIDPQLFREKIESYLHGQNISGWWCLPFNNSVSLRFWGLTRGYDVGGYFGFAHSNVDKLLIVGPTGHVLDMYGGHLIKNFGIDALPFTRAAIVQKLMEEVRGLGLVSLLEGQLFFRGNDPRDVISGNTLLSSKKKIFVIYTVKPISCYEYEVLESQYEEMKCLVEEFEVVFFGLFEIQGGNKMFGGMPWYTHWPLEGTPASPEKKLAELFEKKMFVGLFEYLSVLAFGEDGHICAVKKPRQLSYYDPASFCWDNTLEWDFYHQLGFDLYG